MGTISAATLATLVSLADKYGPVAVQGIINLFKKADPTITDVEAAFAQLKPYSDFGIPDKAPAAPTA